MIPGYASGSMLPLELMTFEVLMFQFDGFDVKLAATESEKSIQKNNNH